MTDAVAETLEPAPPKHHPDRWGLTRAGIVNVWNYYDTLFRFAGGRMILRGTNGSGKGRALEMLLPFLLDADRRKMDATGSGKVRLEDLMRHGAHAQVNRLGYLWLELSREAEEPADRYLTIGALVRFSASTGGAKVWYFTTPLRVGGDLRLMDDRRQPLSREHLGQLIGVDRITDRPDVHREKIAAQVFGLTGSSGKERYAGLLQLLHTLRAPDVGNRIDEGNLPKILSDALPPLSEVTLREAGERLDSLSDSREEQRRLVKAVEQLHDFLDVYRRYVARTLFDAAERTKTAAGEAAALAAQERKANADHTELRSKHERVIGELEEAKERENELGSIIEGLKELPAYQAGLDIENLRKRVEALGHFATGNLEAASARREEEARAVGRADELAEEIRVMAERADAGLASVRRHLTEAKMRVTALPVKVVADLGAAEGEWEHVRCSLTDAAQPVRRPVPPPIVMDPSAPDVVASTVRDVGQTAGRRAGEALNRQAQAAAIEDRAQELRQTEQHVEDLGRRAEEDAERAEARAGERDGTARDLAAEWRRWTSDERTHAILGAVDWSRTAVSVLLLDADALTGTAPDEEVSALDHLATEAAAPACSMIADRRAEVRQARRTDAVLRRQLEEEQQDLRAERDPEPPGVPWTRDAPAGSRPLWRLVDFTGDVGGAERAGLEAALLSAGLLSAAVAEDGSLVAGDGQVLLTADAPVAPRALTEVLSWDSTGSLPEAPVTAVLARIGFGPGHATWVGPDGRWGNGPLRGKHHVDTARFIGAAARSSARAERLNAIEGELSKLDEQDLERTRELERLQSADDELDQYVRSAPKSVDLIKARAEARATADEATRSARAAAEISAKAERLREELAAARRAHGELCARLGLPADVAGLVTVVEAAHEAKRAGTLLADRLDAIHGHREKHERASAEITTAAGGRRLAESAARNSWSEWHEESGKFTTLSEALGDEAEEVRERLRDAEQEKTRVHSSVTKLEALERKLYEAAADAKADVDESRRKAREATGAMTAAVESLGRQVALRGVSEAATSGAAGILSELCLLAATTTTTQVERAAVAVQQHVDTSGQHVGEAGLMRAVQVTAGDLANTFDLNSDNQEGLWLVDLTDATGRQPVALAAARLREQAERAAGALTEREHRVFTDFVIGGVGEELRRRLTQAEGLVKAMDASLRDIRTSHGIGVRLRWELVEPRASPIGRIRELVAETAAVRRSEDTEELIRLLKERVDERFTEDEATGYSEHLRAALDYRQWHRVEVSILGPAPGQVRKISRRAKLSQGETRFVSYLALFAAADAYLTLLPDTARALRLILLDDAFAKVDDRTIGELMGLLVRMDVDFCMTGHALWGAYPQVPSVDIYEIRRAEGTAAAATHVHWDGHTRHYLRSAGGA
ncbi:TIGR02680 family protein [Amycolatopsis sp. NPDC051903]|uniref:TIGR02680 family protein n=1 Tax=Amycolatopsis sp. NPDC051903 TaxID=3363936 RepID=UPI003793254F